LKIAFACDHAGFDLKQEVIDELTRRGHQVVDCGTDSRNSVDYVDFAAAACQQVQNQEVQLAVLVCGTGLGMSITANKFRGIRAALVHDSFTAEMSRSHNQANVLCLGSRVLDRDQALKLLGIWLDTSFVGGRHQRRIDKITAYENGESNSEGNL
jgi:ribose 5-phosphate isomerase B